MVFYQHRIPVPIAINVPNVPPPCTIVFPTVLTNSSPRIPYLKREGEKMLDEKKVYL